MRLDNSGASMRPRMGVVCRSKNFKGRLYTGIFILARLRVFNRKLASLFCELGFLNYLHGKLLLTPCMYCGN